MAKIYLSAFVALMLTISCTPTAKAEDHVEQADKNRWLSPPTYAIKSVREAHSSQTPVIVEPGELDALINPDGGGACPISAALIALQTLRSMTGQPLHPQPHRFALQLFQKHSELKQGRITNERFVDLLGWISDQIAGYDIEVEVLSARNSVHTKSGPYWSDDNGPELSIKGGEINILAYTVTKSDGIVLGRHFALLKESGETQIRVLNPGKPMKDYQFIVEKRETSSAPYKRIYLKSPGQLSDTQPVQELNTVFKIRLIPSKTEPLPISALTIDRMKTAIDDLAEQLKSEGKLTSPRE